MIGAIDQLLNRPAYGQLYRGLQNTKCNSYLFSPFLCLAISLLISLRNLSIFSFLLCFFFVFFYSLLNLQPNSFPPDPFLSSDHFLGSAPEISFHPAPSSTVQNFGSTARWHPVF
ncbi:hypothetical protein CY35_03G119700 [Sphagnum magellanicum]|nr:hypothetical protein CY35_03G119700 [Sphagnum magellanicum]